MKPLGWHSERGGTTFAGEGGRHIEKTKVDKEISEGLEEYVEGKPTEFDIENDDGFFPEDIEQN